MDPKSKRLLQSVGGGVFKTCYSTFKSNYRKADKSSIDEAIEAYGKAKGFRYLERSIITKRNAGCQIFEMGTDKTVLDYCQKSTKI
ncbi:MAG: hypothetical protein IJV75_04960 [Alphaproteobacteria bacterium]|nr:hypothetical protein [Alphaproteobacteria bacterium]